MPCTCAAGFLGQGRHVGCDGVPGDAEDAGEELLSERVRLKE